MQLFVQTEAGTIRSAVNSPVECVWLGRSGREYSVFYAWPAQPDSIATVLSENMRLSPSKWRN